MSSWGQDHFIYKKTEIQGGISPKSVVASGNGLFAAQNMVYRHTVTFYNKYGRLVGTVEDEIAPKDYGFDEYKGDHYKGGPVEAAFSDNGKYLWTSQYQMYGDGFNKPGCDGCNGKSYDPSFVYKINAETQEIENIIKVGSVPKFLAISKDESLLVVSNWSSGDVSIVDLKAEKEIKRVDVGAHPRGVAITKDARKAYVTVMGSTKIAVVDLKSYDVDYLTNVGRSPRSVILSDNDSLLYISVNSSNTLVKYNLKDNTKESVRTKSGPRSMILSPNGDFIYVVNYFDDHFSKIQTDSMLIVEEVSTGKHPIGITANWDDSEIWVACYTGKIEIFKDFDLENRKGNGSFLFGDELASLFGFVGGDYNVIRTESNDKDESPEEKVESFDNELIASNSSSEFAKGADSKRHVRMNETPAFYQNESIGWPARKIEKEKSEARKETVPEEVVEEEPIIEEVVEESTPEPEVVEEVVTTERIMARNGTALSTANWESYKLKKKEQECHYHLIVGSFSIPENAVNYAADLTSQGYSASVIDGSALDYVSIQCFDSRESAKAAIGSVKAELNITGWVMKR